MESYAPARTAVNRHSQCAGQIPLHGRLPPFASCIVASLTEAPLCLSIRSVPTAKGPYTHEPVMRAELVRALVTDKRGVYLDATFGRGGHARALLDSLDADASLLVTDRDPDVLGAVDELRRLDSRVKYKPARFSEIESALDEIDGAVLNGAVFDVGVSMPQLRDGSRGFAFDVDGPLDMRMDTRGGETAATWLNRTPVERLAEVLYTYGDVRSSRSIARSIVAARPLTTTFDLANAVRDATPRSSQSASSLARVFQAIRIHVNDELHELEQGLIQAFELLLVGGRLGVITFHSLEHRLARERLRSWVQPTVPRGAPVESDPPRAKYVVKNKRPTYAERTRNPSARSAMLQVIERVR